MKFEKQTAFTEKLNHAIQIKLETYFGKLVVMLVLQGSNNRRWRGEEEICESLHTLKISMHFECAVKTWSSISHDRESNPVVQLKHG